MNYCKAQLEVKSKYPPNKPMFHKYSFYGEVRTYRNKLTLIDESVKYLGTTTKFVDHWNKSEKKYYPESNVLPPDYTVEHFLDDTKKHSQSKIDPKSKSPLPMSTNEYFVYSVRGEKQYYKIYKEWLPEVVKEYDIKFLGIASLSGKSISDYENTHQYHSNGQKAKTTTRVKRVQIPAANKPDEKHCIYCEVELTDKMQVTATALTIDHIKPLVRGGTNHKSNLRNCCWECNNEKGGLMLHSYIQLLNLKMAELKPGLELDKIQIKIKNANRLAKEIENG